MQKENLSMVTQFYWHYFDILFKFGFIGIWKKMQVNCTDIYVKLYYSRTGKDTNNVFLMVLRSFFFSTTISTFWLLAKTAMSVFTWLAMVNTSKPSRVQWAKMVRSLKWCLTDQEFIWVSWLLVELQAKGQLNSEWIYEAIVSPKMPTKNFCPTL